VGIFSPTRDPVEGVQGAGLSFFNGYEPASSDRLVDPAGTGTASRCEVGSHSVENEPAS